MPKRRSKYGEDKLVQFHSGVLHGAMAAAGLTAGQLAKRVRTSRQLIQHMASGERVHSGRRSRLQHVARAIGIPLHYLLASPDAIRAVVTPVLGYEEQYSLRTAFAAWGFIERCVEACTRDLARASVPEWTDRANYDAQVLVSLKLSLSGLLQLAPLREATIRWLDPLEARRHQLEPGPASLLPYATPQNARREDPAHEQAILGLIAAYDYLLQPWLVDGTATVNYRWLRAALVQHHARRYAELGVPGPTLYVMPRPSFYPAPLEDTDPYILLGWE